MVFSLLILQTSSFFVDLCTYSQKEWSRPALLRNPIIQQVATGRLLFFLVVRGIWNHKHVESRREGENHMK